jgi:hypothetical protein
MQLINSIYRIINRATNSKEEQYVDLRQAECIKDDTCSAARRAKARAMGSGSLVFWGRLRHAPLMKKSQDRSTLINPLNPYARLGSSMYVYASEFILPIYIY